VFAKIMMEKKNSLDVAIIAIRFLPKDNGKKEIVIAGNYSKTVISLRISKKLFIVLFSKR
jgi:hypothetical protein